jgi:hypothetical protein
MIASTDPASAHHPTHPPTTNRPTHKPTIPPKKVERAYQLFYKSTINAMNAGLADVDLGESNVRGPAGRWGGWCWVTAGAGRFVVRGGCWCPNQHQPTKTNQNQQTPYPQTQLAATRATEERIRDRLPLNGHLGYKKLMDDLMGLGCTPTAVGLAVKVMLAKGELKKKNEGKLLQRVR